MVGIVVVSHSHSIVKGILDICRQMVGDAVPISGVGGLRSGELGTDPKMVEKAILEMDQEEGVLIVAGIGSAVLAAEVAQEAIAQQVHCIIADTPLVEGSLAASLQAYVGGSLEEVLQAAHQAKTLKKVGAI